MIHMHSNSNESLIFSHYSNNEGYSWESLEGRFLLNIKTKPLDIKEGEYPISFYISEKEINNHLICIVKCIKLKYLKIATFMDSLMFLQKFYLND